MKIFKDRKAAGQILAQRLKNIKADLVLGIPRGGVVVASEVAKELKLPLDIVVTRKIGAPFQPELALGAVNGDGQVIWEENLVAEVGVEKSSLEDIIKKEQEEIVRRQQTYRQGKYPLDVNKKSVILVDDGVATGSTALAAISYLKRHGAIVSLAVPVASKEALNRIRSEVEEVVVLDIPEYFQAVGQFYQEFLPVSDQEVIQLLL